MKHIASLVRDGMVQYALVDEDTGELTQFAQVLVPEGWDLHSSAVLGHNLVQVTGLNGRPAKAKASKALPPSPPSAQLAFDDDVPSQPDSSAPKGRGKGTGSRAKAKAEHRVQRYIPGEEVWAIIDQYPDGITARAIAERLWRLTGDGSEVTPHWVKRTVENRIASAMADAKAGRKPQPFLVEYRDFVRADGTVSPNQFTKVMLPRSGGHTAVEEES